MESVLFQQELQRERNPRGNRQWQKAKNQPVHPGDGQTVKKKQRKGVAWGDTCQLHSNSGGIYPRPKPPGDFLPRKGSLGSWLECQTGGHRAKSQSNTRAIYCQTRTLCEWKKTLFNSTCQDCPGKPTRDHPSQCPLSSALPKHVSRRLETYTGEER